MNKEELEKVKIAVNNIMNEVLKKKKEPKYESMFEKRKNVQTH